MTAAKRSDPVRARKLAEQCFNVARSTTFEGERSAAIARGEAIAQRAGLSLDGFDIPGRSKAKAEPPRYSSSPFHDGGTFSFKSSPVEDVEEMLRRASAARASWNDDSWYRRERERAFRGFDDAMRRAANAAGVRPGETVYEARRRAFDEATATADSELHRRNDLRARWPSVDSVVNALRARRIEVRAARVRIATLAGDPDQKLWVVTEPDLCVLDQWSLRELADVVVG